MDGGPAPELRAPARELLARFTVEGRTYTQPTGRTWRTRSGIAKRQKAATVGAFRAFVHWSDVRRLLVARAARTPLLVTLKRVHPPGATGRWQPCDDDGLRTACKHVRDQVADLLIPGMRPGQADGDPLLRFAYAQASGGWGVQVSIEVDRG